MDKTSFIIFTPDGKKFHWTPNWIALIFGFLPLCICACFQDGLHQNANLSSITTTYFILLGVMAMGCIFVSFFIHKPLNGKLEGEIIFENDSIIINDKKYMLRTINDLDFLFADYYGKMSSNGRDLNPKLYQGVGNYITFSDNMNVTQTLYFQMLNKDSHLALSPFINEAIRAKKMSFNRGIELVGIENISTN
jgi:hypothetical protein